jgi:2-hydroxy-3-oxopropionate reductase
MNVAVVGTGIMGGHMARRLAQAGFQVTGWNRSADKLAALPGVHASADLRATLAAADIAIVMLSGAPVIDDVLFSGGERAAVRALRPGSRLVVMSSVPVATARAQAAAVAPLGIHFLDAPVSGGEPGARDGTLAIMVGAARDAFAGAAPVFAPLGRATLLGPVGSGQLAKLANQVIVGGTLVAISEALTLVTRGGADPAAVREAWMGGFADSKVLRVLGKRMVDGNFEPGSPAAYQLRDMRAAAAQARELGLELGQLNQVIERFGALERSGEIERDVSIIIREIARQAQQAQAGSAT